MLISLWNELSKALALFVSLPKSILFNLRYLPLQQALRLPILISYRIKLKDLRGRIVLDRVAPGIVQIGFNSLSFATGHGDGLWNVTGTVHFHGKARLGCHPIINVKGTLEIGDQFECGHCFLLFCDEHVHFGNNTLISWNVEVMDTDIHHITDAQAQTLNPAKAVSVGEHVWIGSHACLLKGSSIAEHSIVAAHAVVTKAFDQANILLAGNPATVKKHSVDWQA
ncbi:MAG: hypothetical protein CO186_08745 [Zetaproteobacteria bacterium CG_4_9_14_3_um_filter_49_83]|nr:MAG: hypothetical protein AUJ56_04290 [Zetaproteobacteria bacterium CG1_02_49_23]PIQ31630.1 MAG: hypothetical protein COW62_09090 [Zetaproteobacteria bacterium CG17_big_fil_post_rev_8_21_14_2_50_50_13]PIY55496.1 MAG: hypothetical protein COZ00_08995 [Zetaproteobacteria bacterium CG_4_10_14_0_8_um_filter_49_80]PJA34852.1 MAG: hypothetical protein CO186_08745 [Zetaproteobacteria bacterium CG_4_9_14_3_um_filter_49_83]